MTQMRVIVSEAASSFIEEKGGRLYVWPTRNACCGSAWLSAAPSPRRRIEFARRADVREFELYLPAALARLPEELHLELRRFPRRVEAYWNGCAWIV
jgi:hypothetical protein